METKLNLCELLQIILDAKMDAMWLHWSIDQDFSEWYSEWYSKAIQDLAKLLWIEWHFWM